MKRENIYLVAIILILGAFGVINKCQDNEIESLSFERDFYKEQADTFRTKSGESAARIKTLEGDIKDVRKVLSDSLEKLEYTLDLKDKAIQELVNMTSETNISSELEVDSTGSGSESTRWHDLEISGIPICDNLSASTVSINIKVRDSITFVRYKRGKWFQEKELVMDGVSWNPNTSINGIQDISIKEDPNKFALVFGPGVVYYDGKIRPVISITFGYKLLQR